MSFFLVLLAFKLCVCVRVLLIVPSRSFAWKSNRLFFNSLNCIHFSFVYGSHFNFQLLFLLLSLLLWTYMYTLLSFWLLNIKAMGGQKCIYLCNFLNESSKFSIFWLLLLLLLLWWWCWLLIEMRSHFFLLRCSSPKNSIESSVAFLLKYFLRK